MPETKFKKQLKTYIQNNKEYHIIPKTNNNETDDEQDWTNKQIVNSSPGISKFKHLNYNTNKYYLI